jgi:hypothetical protein
MNNWLRRFQAESLASSRQGRQCLELLLNDCPQTPKNLSPNLSGRLLHTQGLEPQSGCLLETLV